MTEQNEGYLPLNLYAAVKEAIEAVGYDATIHEIRAFIDAKYPGRAYNTDRARTYYHNQRNAIRRKREGGSKRIHMGQTLDTLNVVKVELDKANLSVRQCLAQIEFVEGLAFKVGGITNLINMLRTIVNLTETKIL